MWQNPIPTHAMILAAGLGSRMRPLTLTTPKPLVRVQGRALLDRALDALEHLPIERVVVNIHHLGARIEAHLAAARQHRCFEIVLSDERATLLDSGGGVVKALPLLGEAPFFVLNSDTFWQEAGETTNLARLANAFDPARMDMLLLTVRRDQAVFPERGDFLSDTQGRLTRARPNISQALIYGGALIVNPTIFTDAPATPHSLNLYFDRAITRGRLYGLPLDGRWYTLTTVDSIAIVDNLLTG